MLKVLSVKQPWADLLVKGIKPYEIRTWDTKYRGPVYIHASKQIDKEAPKELGTEAGWKEGGSIRTGR